MTLILFNNKQIRLMCHIFIITAFMVPVYSAGNKSQYDTIPKKKVILQLTFTSKQGVSRNAVVRANERVKDIGMVPVKNLPVLFFVHILDSIQLIKKDLTDNKGNAVLEITGNIPKDPNGIITLSAVVGDNPHYEKNDVAGSVKECDMNLQIQQIDTVTYLLAYVTQVEANGEINPVEYIDVTFYVQRLFGLLPLGDEPTVSTDENGIAKLILPADLKGNLNGKVNIFAKIEYNELYGNVEDSVSGKFGKPLVMETPPFPRTMWGRKSPVWMSLAFFLALAGILAALSYLIFQLVRIKKESG